MVSLFCSTKDRPSPCSDVGLSLSREEEPLLQEEDEVLRRQPPQKSNYSQGHYHNDDDEEGDDHACTDPTRDSVSPWSSADPDHTSATTALEDRVRDLEDKLATLARVLQQQQHQHHRRRSSLGSVGAAVSPSCSPPASPPGEIGHSHRSLKFQHYDEVSSVGDGSDRYLHPHGATSSFMPLDSPAPHSRPRKSNQNSLSYQVLHCSDEDSPTGSWSGEVTDSSFYLPESLPTPNDPFGHPQPPVSPIREGRSARSHTPMLGPLSSPLPTVSSPPSPTSKPQKATPLVSNARRLGASMTSSTLSSSHHQSLHSRTVMMTPPTTRTDEANGDTPKTKKDKDQVKSKWLDYLNSFQESHYDTDKQMEEFVKVPSAVEAILSFGFWICVDSFLYILAILPIRFVWSTLLLLRFLFLRMAYGQVPEGPFRFHRRHSYQLIQVSIIYTIYKYVLMPISIGKFYHWIRGQAMVKLYVLIAMVEVFDRLMCSLGQDCLDSLYWNTTRRPRSSRLLVSVLVVLTYTMIHSALLFVHVATLNVAMNSDDQALISLLIGGNFAEIKSTVFKKYNKANLFKITASDICERFKLALFLTLVMMLNMSQGMDEKMILRYVHMCGVVWCAEWLSDWIKHSFITKFNFISSLIYPEYGLLLAGDVTGLGHEGVNLDHSHAVVKRIGFAQLPLVCVMARYAKEAFKYATYDAPLPGWMVALGIFGLWLVLLLLKLSLGSFLKKVSLAKLRAAPEFSSKNAKLQVQQKKYH